MNDNDELPFGDDPFPRASEYRHLYEREIIRTPTSKILDMAEGGRLFGRVLLDVGGGTGRLSIDAKDNGAYPVCLDISPFLPDETEMESRKIPIIRRSMQDYLKTPDYEQFDIVACQNGIEYWILDCSANDFNETLRIGGWLLFNLPVIPPPESPSAERWTGTDGKTRTESLWLDGNVVRRKIISQNGMHHRTSHPYVTVEQISDILGQNYRIKTFEDGDDEILVSCQRMR